MDTHPYFQLISFIGVEFDLDFYDVVRTRRSVRSYRPDPISDDVLDQVLEAVRIAPSASNR